jgi:2-polyprenyl-3-methyl-5-hydroxy-6-metoxy-1,4-benzoquinol methylase
MNKMSSLRDALRKSSLWVKMRKHQPLLKLRERVNRALGPKARPCPEHITPSRDSLNFPLRSLLCTQAFIESSIYARWCQEFRQPPVYHRKHWEFVYICQALQEHGMLGAGKRGLGFGCGQEPLGSLFARLGCRLTLTDMAHEQAADQGWVDTNQHAVALNGIWYKSLCDRDTFFQQAEFQTVDMNDIPSNLRDYDFCWSSCALEHLGSIEQGLNFIKNAMACLKPGGVAVHTTEYNVMSNKSTIDHTATVLFRRRDLDRLQEELRSLGHHMQPLHLDPGSAVLDQYVDMPPYRSDRHLKLALGRFVATSVGVIIQKARH